jgi:hypothetical protein
VQEQDGRDATGLIDYVFYVIAHAGALWRGANQLQHAALQSYLFPAGLVWERSGFARTALTGSVFYELTDVEDATNEVATLEGRAPFSIRGVVCVA